MSASGNGRGQFLMTGAIGIAIGCGVGVATGAATPSTTGAGCTVVSGRSTKTPRVRAVSTRALVAVCADAVAVDNTIAATIPSAPAPLPRFNVLSPENPAL